MLALRRGALSHRGDMHVPPVTMIATRAAAVTWEVPRVIAAPFSSQPGSPTVKEGNVSRQPMHPLVRDLFKRFIYVGRDYPLPPPYVRDKAREAILKNAHLTDTREVSGE